MKALQVVIRGFTASYRIPFAIAGVQVCSPVPSYGNLLGLISCCAGRRISTNETRIGFEFSSSSKSSDLERIVRWDYNIKKLGMPRLNDKGPGVRQREYLIDPLLVLYLSNLEFEDAFLHPKGIPTLGRSQDLACIELEREVELIPVKKGTVGGTLIPLRACPEDIIPGLMFRVPECMQYNETTLLREALNNEVFIATAAAPGVRTEIELSSNLFAVSDGNQGECIYIHEWKE